MLVWVYYSAQILFFGAEFTQVYAKRYGSGVVPAEDAVPVTEEARAKQGMPDSERVAAVAQGQEPQPAGRGRTATPPTTREGATPQSAQPSTQQTAQPSTYKYVGAAAGAASLTFIVGLFVGAVVSIAGLIVGAVRGVRR